MTVKEQLHQLVDSLDEDTAHNLLTLAVTQGVIRKTSSLALPSFVGAGDSGRDDISSRAREILREELGKE